MTNLPKTESPNTARQTLSAVHASGVIQCTVPTRDSWTRSFRTPLLVPPNKSLLLLLQCNENPPYHAILPVWSDPRLGADRMDRMITRS